MYWDRIPFGKYVNQHFNQIHDLKYLQWIIGKLNNECQIRFCAEAIMLEIDRRRKERDESRRNNSTGEAETNTTIRV